MILSIKEHRIQTFGTVSVTGTTSETILSSVIVPANTYGAGELICIDTMLSNNGASNWNIKLYWVPGTTATFTGATQLSVRNLTVTTQRFAGHLRRLYIRTTNGTGSGITLGTEIFSTTTNTYTDWASGTISNLAIDWTTDNTFFVVGKLTNSTHTISSYYLKIWEY